MKAAQPADLEAGESQEPDNWDNVQKEPFGRPSPLLSSPIKDKPEQREQTASEKERLRAILTGERRKG